MKLAFLGDSITYGYGLENKEERFSTIMCNRLQATEANFGITGTLMAKAGINKTDGKSFVDRLDFVLDGDIVVVFGGTNDYFWSDVPIGNKLCDEGFFYCAVDKICKKICNCRDAGKTLFVTPYPHNGVGNFWGGKDYNDANRHNTDELNFNGHRLVDYVNVLEEVAAGYGIPVLNLHKALGFDWRVHTIDGCHPNSDGHKWLAEQIGNACGKLI